jgi:hypothetical protein
VRTQKTRKYKKRIHVLTNKEDGASQHVKNNQERARGTHQLKRKRATGQEIRILKRQANQAHSHPFGHQRSDKSGHGKKASGPGELTFWRARMETQVKKLKKASETGGQTHKLEGVEQG